MKSVMNYDLAAAPTMTAPRASFNLSHGHKTTIDFDYLYPIFHHIVNPGETHTLNPHIYARLATPFHPVMDNMFLDIHFFFVPLRIIMDNSRKFFGEQIDPGDSIDYTIPYMTATATTGYAELSIHDYLGLPTKVPDYQHSALFHRAYVSIYNEWFRDQNLIDSVALSTADGPDTTTSTALQKRGKRHDLFTSLLVAPQKSETGAVDLPLGTTAPITGIGSNPSATWSASSGSARETDGSTTETYANYLSSTGAGPENWYLEEDPSNAGYPNIRVDLSNATAATIVELRTAMAIQSILELDARAGTRYAEIVYSIYGVQFNDLTYRPLFLSGASQQIGVQPIAQTSNDGTNGNVGDLSGYGEVRINEGGFTHSFTEHGVLMGICSARADLTYSQGLDKIMKLSTRYDFLHPMLQNIGDDYVTTDQIYCQDPTTDTGATGTPDNERVLGYQERYYELKYIPSKVTGLFRPNATQSLESWILTEEFLSTPELDQTFIEQNTPMDRVIAVPSQPHLILDTYMQYQAARPMQMYSIPGMGTRF